MSGDGISKFLEGERNSHGMRPKQRWIVIIGEMFETKTGIILIIHIQHLKPFVPPWVQPIYA